MGEDAGKRVKLNLGCGGQYWPGWENCDLHSDAGTQIDCRRLPFGADYADQIESIHFVEHVHRIEVDNMLINWHKTLKKGGKLAIEVPCLNKMAQMIVNGERDIRLTTLGIFGDPRDKKPDMMHKWAYSEEEMTEMLRGCGFADVKVVPPHFHFDKRDMRVEAAKP